MRRLAAHQSVTVELDGETEAIGCQIGGVSGPVATLSPLTELAPELRELLAPGRLGFMTFRHAGGPVALRGVTLAVAESQQLEFVVIDGVQVAERRGAERIRLLTPVRAAVLDADGAVTASIATVTSNLSLGGALITSRPGLGGGPKWQLELSLPRDPDPVRCDALLARQTPTHVGVKFDNLEDADRLRLAQTLADHQRRPVPGA
jgi:hypothetical protein